MHIVGIEGQCKKKARPMGVRSAAAVSNGKMLEFVISFTQKIIAENLADLHSSELALHIWESGSSMCHS